MRDDRYHRLMVKLSSRLPLGMSMTVAVGWLLVKLSAYGAGRPGGARGLRLGRRP
jgi:hypothetical protein